MWHARVVVNISSENRESLRHIVDGFEARLVGEGEIEFDVTSTVSNTDRPRYGYVTPVERRR